MRLTSMIALGTLAAALSCGGSGSGPTGTTTGTTGGSNGGTAGGSGGSGNVNVTIQDFSFTPASLTVKAGTTVKWTNNGPSAHTTVSDAGVWNSGTLAAPGSGGGYGGGGGMTGGSFSFTLSQPGTYHYHCSIHPPSLYPNFTGVIVVTP